jgi:hypothetical protein
MRRGGVRLDKGGSGFSSVRVYELDGQCDELFACFVLFACKS